MSRITINSNIASLTAQRNVAKSTASLQQSFARLSSGLRINSAKDDAAGLAIAKSLGTDRRVFSQGVRNANDAVSLLSIAEGAGRELSNILIRLRELAEGAANGTQSVTNRIASDEESKALVNEYNRIVNSTEFNSLQLLDGNLTSFRVQTGYGENGGLNFDLGQELAAARGNLSLSLEDSKLYGTVPNVVTAGDFNSDGIQDYIAFDGAGDPAQLFTGIGDGTFNSGLDLGFGSVHTVAHTVDFNGDGNMDIIFDDPAMGQFQIGLGDGTGSFSLTGVSTSSSSMNIEIADVNGDGTLDVVTSDTVNDTISAYLGNGSGGVTAGPVTSLQSNSGQTFSLGDLNNDGILDLVSGGGSTTSAFSIYLGNGDGSFSFSSQKAISSPIDKVAIADFNHDGSMDILALDNSGSASFYNGDGAGGATVDEKLSAGSNSEVDIIDFDGDGYKDVLITSGNDSTLYVLPGNENGDFAAPDIISIGLNADTSDSAFADFDGDGVLDIVATSTTDSVVDVFLQNTDDTTELKRLVLLTQEDARQAMSDIDNALERVSNELGAIGAVTSRLSTAISHLQQTTENLGSAQSRIEDADVAFEAANLVRNQILQEAGVAVLTQANQLPALALILLEGS